MQLYQPPVVNQYRMEFTVTFFILLSVTRVLSTCKGLDATEATEWAEGSQRED